MRRRGDILLLLAAVSLPGCMSSSGGVAAPVQQAVRAGEPAEAAPARAALPLESIEPAVTRPAAPASVPALSERAARQIAQAEPLAGERRFTEAQLELERALRYDPQHPRLHRALAWLHLRAGNPEGARTHAEQAVGVDPDDALVHYVLGRVAHEHGDTGAALREYRTALLCGNFGEDAFVAALCHFHLAQVLGAEGYASAGLTQYEAFAREADAAAAANMDPEATGTLVGYRRTATLERAALLEQLRRPGEAAELLASLVAQEAGNFDLLSRYVRLCVQAGRPGAALGAVQALPSYSDELVALLRDIFAAEGRPERLAEELRTRAQAAPEEPGWMVSLADALVATGQAEQARRELEVHLARQPEADAVRARLLQLLGEQGAWSAVLDACSEAIEKRPEVRDWDGRFLAAASAPAAVAKLLSAEGPGEDYASAYLLGRLAQKVGRLEDAHRWLRRSYAAAPAFVPTRVALAEIHLRQYEWEDALRVAGRAETDVPEDPALERLLGEAYLGLDDPRSARRHFAAASQADRSDTEAMLKLAIVDHQLGDVNLARQHLQLLLKTDPTQDRAREMLAAMYVSERQLTEAAAQLEELRTQARTPLAAVRAAALINLLRTGDGAAYRQALEAALREHEPDAATWLALADSLARTAAEDARAAYARLPQKRAAYAQALALEPDNEEAALGLVEADEQLLDYESAAARLRGLLPRHPNRHTWRLRLINLNLNMHEWDAALGLIQWVEEHRPPEEAHRKLYRLATAETLRLARREEELEARLREWAAGEDTPGQWTVRLARELLGWKRPAEALAVLECAAHEGAPAEGVVPLLVEALIAVGRAEQAQQVVLDRIYDDPANEAALLQLIGALFNGGRRGDALELVENQQFVSRNPLPYQGLALQELSAAGEHESCIALIQRIIDEQLGRADSRVDIGFLRSLLIEQLVRARQYGRAEAKLKDWPVDPTDPTDNVERARLMALCHQEQGRAELATAVLAEALRLLPDDVGLNNDVAYGWIDQGVRLEEAEGMICYAVAQDPRRSAYLDTLGWLRYKQGKWAEARKWLARAVALDAEPDAVVLDHLGDACYRIGSPQEAVQYWTAAVKAAEDSATAERSPEVGRVRATAAAKIEAVRQGEPPQVAPAAEVGGQGEAKGS
ncbi:MAG TPA: tetratricopeptide repeat protein [Phycisphaerae bacterium]|nr:tetratricopeptide repeat protein [Phycisphaerae bacterium]HNU45760.1 tetratricopeptide repeat protein [Phycisphaerae bacterium]